MFEYPREVYKHVSKEIRVVTYKRIYITNAYNWHNVCTSGSDELVNWFTKIIVVNAYNK